MTTIIRTILLGSFLILTTACYRVPGEEDFSVIPSTNNPDITGSKPSLTPNISY